MALNQFLRIEKPYPIRIQGISLYALWDKQDRPPEPPLKPVNEIISIPDDTGFWWTVQLTSLPSTDKVVTPRVMTDREAEDEIYKLRKRLNEIYPNTPPVYLIFYIDKIFTLKPRFSRFYIKKTKDRVDDAVTEAQERFVENMQAICELDSGHPTKGWLPTKFNLYDRKSQRLGWLIISPTRALIAGVDEEQVLILTDHQLQPYDLNRAHHPGIPSERYRDIIASIAQWVSNQDAYQAVNKLQTLVDSGQKAVDGQVFLSLALALIGILLAFFPIQNYQTPLKASLICLIAASLLFWLFARSARKSFAYIGWLFALLVIPFMFAWPQVVSLFQALINFLF